jgi:hypothetical protein
MHFEIEKNLEQIHVCTCEHSMFTHKVLRRKDIFCGICKNDQEKHVNKILSTKKFVFICLFTHAIKIIFLSWNFLSEHKMFRCTPRYVFRIFFKK